MSTAAFTIGPLRRLRRQGLFVKVLPSLLWNVIRVECRILLTDVETGAALQLDDDEEIEEGLSLVERKYVGVYSLNSDDEISWKEGTFGVVMAEKIRRALKAALIYVQDEQEENSPLARWPVPEPSDWSAQGSSLDDGAGEQAEAEAAGIA